MHQFVIVKKIYVNYVVLDEAGGDVWITETGYGDCVIIDPNCIVDVQFIQSYFLCRSLITTKRPQLKHTVVIVNGTVSCSFRILFNVFHFYVALWFTSVNFIECSLKILLQIILRNIISSVTVLCDSDCSC